MASFRFTESDFEQALAAVAGHDAFPASKPKGIDADEVREVAVQRAEELFEQILGQPTDRARNGHWRFGKRGSVSAHVRGSKSGQWFDHESGQGGDLIDFWAIHGMGLASARSDFRRVVESLASRLGLDPGTGLTDLDRESLRARQAAREAQAQLEAQQAAQARQSVLEAVQSVAQPLGDDCPGRRYLKSRGIHTLPPECTVAFHPANSLERQRGLAGAEHGALIVWASTPQGEVTGGQRILLDSLGRKQAWDGPAKPMFGQLGDSLVRLPAKPNTTTDLFIAESPEAALTIWQATGAETWATLGAGRFKVATDQAPLGRKVILCPDQDAPDSPAAIAYSKARDSLAQRHPDLWEAATPTPEGSKHDLNDTLQASGTEAVSDALKAAFRVSKIDRAPDPTYPPITEDRATAIDATGKAIRNWGQRAIAASQASRWLVMQYADLDSCDPLYRTKQKQVRQKARAMISGSQGVGKTRALVGGGGKPGVLHEARGLVSLMLLPDHRKAAEALSDYRANAPANAPDAMQVWGRSQPDPSNPKDKMCRVHELAEAVAQAGQSVRTSLCLGCPFRDICGYRQQEHQIEELARSERGVVLFSVHETLSLPLPTDLNPDLVILDERLRNLGIERHRLNLEDLQKRPANGSAGPNGQTADAIADYEAWAIPAQQAILAVAEAHRAALAAQGAAPAFTVISPKEPPQGLLRGLVGAGWQAEHFKMAAQAIARVSAGAAFGAAKRAQEAHSRSILEGGAFDAAGQFKREAAQMDFGHARRLVALFTTIALDLDHGQADSVGVWLNGDSLEVSALQTFRHAGGHFLHLDGTGSRRMAEALFGRLDLHHHRVERNAKVIQITGHSFSKASITGQGWHSGRRLEQAKATREKLQEVIQRTGANAVFAQKAVLESLGLSGDERAGHFGALRGINRWENAQTGIIIGRLQPAPQEVEAIARAFAAKAGDSFEALPSGEAYPKTTRWMRVRDGAAQPLETEYHPDPWADLILTQIREKEVEQALDRLRLIHNPEPKTVYLLNALVIDATIDAVVLWSNFSGGGTRPQRCFEQFGFLPLSGAEAAKMFPRIWSSERTARADIKQLSDPKSVSAKFRQSGSKELLLPSCRNLVYHEANYSRFDARGRGKVYKALINTKYRSNALAFLQAFDPSISHAEVLQ